MTSRELLFLFQSCSRTAIQDLRIVVERRVSARLLFAELPADKPKIGRQRGRADAGIRTPDPFIRCDGPSDA
jgi:hypothetical protein